MKSLIDMIAELENEVQTKDDRFKELCAMFRQSVSTASDLEIGTGSNGVRTSAIMARESYNDLQASIKMLATLKEIAQ